MGSHKLVRGSHTTPDGKRVHAGESFNPTEKTIEDHGDGRIVKNQSVFMMPDVPWLDDEDDDGSGDGQ